MQSSKLRVLFIARRYPPSVGGMEKLAYELSHSLENNSEIVLDRVTWGGSNKMLIVGAPYIFLRSVWLAMTKKYDVVHLCDCSLSILGWSIFKLTKTPFVQIANGLDVTLDNNLYQYVISRCSRRASRVIAVSRATAKQVEQKFSIPNSKITVIPIGVHEPQIRSIDRHVVLREVGIFDGNSRFILTTGRLVKRKGHEWFIRNVFPELVSAFPDLKYVIVGDGPEMDPIRRAVDELGFRDSIKLAGRVSDELRDKLLSSADLFIMPNIHVPGDMEGFGIVIIEAAIMGLPVVASGIEGILDAVADGRNGTLLPAEDGQAWITRLGELLSDPKEIQSLSVKFSDYTRKNNTWNAVASQYQLVYRSVSDLR